VAQWPRDGLPANPGGWVVAVARRRALDRLRRESARAGKERDAVQEWAAAGPDGSAVAGDDQLALLFACCHPALDPAVRVTLTLRVVCGLPTASIARLLLLSEPAVAQRIVRAKRKIRDAGIRLRMPDPGERPARLASVLPAVYRTFAEGHSPHGTAAVVRDDLCEEALRLARRLHRLLPDEPEVAGLLALILLTSARAATRADEDGALVLLTDQDRSRWDQGRMAEGRSLVETALARRRPAPYQLQAAIGACHADAATAADTDWRQIAALYGELLRFDPSPVIEANRAVAVAYAEGPAAGLAILDSSPTASASPQPPTLTTSCAAGSLPRTRSPDSHPAARPPPAQVDRAIRACLSGAHSYLPRARSQKAGQHHRGSRSRCPDSGTSADDGCLQARFAWFMALGSAAGRRVPPRAPVPCCQVPRRG
jgi:RNA polymerase sigma-70 factor (ECF subfamily)